MYYLELVEFEQVSPDSLRRVLNFTRFKQNFN